MLTEERKNIMATQAHAVSSGQALKKKIFLNKFLTVFWKIFRALLLIALGYILVYPLFYMLSMTFRDAQDMYDVTVTWIPKHFTMENLARVWDAMEFPAAFGRTLLFSVFCSLFSLVTCSLAGYGLARFKFKGSGALFALMLFCRSLMRVISPTVMPCIERISSIVIAAIAFSSVKPASKTLFKTLTAF